MHKEMEWYRKGIIELWYMVKSYELLVIRVPEEIKKTPSKLKWKKLYIF